MKRVFIIHGWDGYPEEGWFPWLKNNLEVSGFQVFVPKMPRSEEPRINNWIPKIKEIVDNPDEQTYFIGHSMGCQAISRYLETLEDDIQVGGVVFVAGFFKKLTNLGQGNIEKDVVREWLETSVDFNRVKKHIKKSIAIFSDDDPYVPLDNIDEFKNKLNSEILLEHNQGHFSGGTGVKKLPIAFESMLKISR